MLQGYRSIFTNACINIFMVSALDPLVPFKTEELAPSPFSQSFQDHPHLR